MKGTLHWLEKWNEQGRSAIHHLHLNVGVKLLNDIISLQHLTIGLHSIIMSYAIRCVQVSPWQGLTLHLERILRVNSIFEKNGI